MRAALTVVAACWSDLSTLQHNTRSHLAVMEGNMYTGDIDMARDIHSNGLILWPHDHAVMPDYVATQTTEALSQLKLGTSREPSELTDILSITTFDRGSSTYHQAFWRAGYPFALLDVILDQGWYDSFVADSPVQGELEDPSLALSGRSKSTLVAITSHGSSVNAL